MPDYARLLGPTTEATRLRQGYADAVTRGVATLCQGDTTIQWGDLCRITYEAALEVLGPRGRPDPRPWMRGREEDKRILDNRVLQASEQVDRYALRADFTAAEQTQRLAALTARRAAVRDRRRTLRRWERTYWTDVQERANQAEAANDPAATFQLFRELAGRRRTIRGTGALTVHDVESEREAWARHFQQVSVGRGAVHGRVWEHVPDASGGGQASWLGLPPSPIEVDQAIARMKNRKAPGHDQVTAEALKYGGPVLRNKLTEVVRTMWTAAVRSADGAEGSDWPSEWKLCVMVPLWKRKGSKALKNTWRGITLLSVGSKLLARIAADRLLRWSEGWLHEHQCGFRRNRGTDDALQVSRRIIEDIARSTGDE